NVHAIAGRQVTAHFAENHNLSRIDVRGNNPVAADRHAIAGKVDRALHAAIDISDSEPVTSPLITSDLPIVAWSAVVEVVETGRGAATGSFTTGAVLAGIAGRSGSPGRDGVAG